MTTTYTCPCGPWNSSAADFKAHLTSEHALAAEMAKPDPDHVGIKVHRRPRPVTLTPTERRWIGAEVAWRDGALTQRGTGWSLGPDRELWVTQLDPATGQNRLVATTVDAAIVVTPLAGVTT